MKKKPKKIFELWIKATVANEFQEDVVRGMLSTTAIALQNQISGQHKGNDVEWVCEISIKP